MRKRYALRLIALALIIPILAALVFAAGGYVASKNSDVFHDPDCSYVDSIADHNLIYFDSLEDALASGRRGCSRCDPESGSYIRDSSGSDLDSSSYSYGFSYGREYGYELGYHDGFVDGEDAGYSSGYAAGASDAEEVAQAKYEAKLEEELSAASRKQFWISVFSFIPLLVFVCGICVARNQRKANEQIAALNEQLQQYETGWQKHEFIHVLGLIADMAGMSMDEFADQLYINYLLQCGYSETDAKARLQTKKKNRTK